MKGAAMHPVINSDDCIGCASCIAECPMEVLDLDDGVCAVADADSCIGCGACIDSCPNSAITDLADD